jgi:hypothetical protein
LFDKEDAVESLQIAKDSFEIAKSLKEKFKENSKGYTALH